MRPRWMVVGVVASELLTACGDNHPGTPQDASADAAPPEIHAPWVHAGTGTLWSFAAGDQVLVASLAPYPAGQSPSTAFVERLDSNGMRLWRRTVSGSLWFADIDDRGAMLVVANSAITIDQATADITLTGTYAPVAIAAQLEADGQVRWARPIASSPSVSSFDGASVTSRGSRMAWSWSPTAQSLHVEGEGDRVWADQALVALFDTGGDAATPMKVAGGRSIVHLDDDASFVMTTETALQRIRDDGTLVWSQPFDFAPRDYVVTLDASNDGLFATGYTTSILELCGSACPDPTPFIAGYATDGARTWRRQPFGPNVGVLAVHRLADDTFRILGSFVGHGAFDVGLPSERTIDVSASSRALYTADVKPDGTLVDVRNLGELGCLTPRGAAWVDGAWIVAVERAASVALGCSEELTVVDGVLMHQPGSDQTGWFVTAIQDPS